MTDRSPEPGQYPDHLGARFDWMAVSHPGLYQMVQNDINVDGAQEVARLWQHASVELSELGEELTELLGEIADAWDGPAAAHAAENVTELSTWARNTAAKAGSVSQCVTEQAELAARARETMPPPADDGRSAMPHGTGDARPPQKTDTAHAFVGGGFGVADHVLADQQAVAEASRERHAQAARVMDQFQSASREVHQTVPRFSQPDPPMVRGTGGKHGKIRSGSGLPLSTRRAKDRHDTNDQTVAAAAVGTGGAALPSGGIGGIGGIGAGGIGGIGAGADGTAGPFGTPKLGARGDGRDAAAAPRATAAGNPASGGPMPFGGTPPGGRDEDRAHRSPGYLDDDLWSDLHGGLRVSRPVIGADDA